MEFQKILDHRGIVISDPIGALAYLQLARTLALSATRSNPKPRTNFIAFWRDADRDIPLMGLAKSEFANLNKGKNRED